MKVVVNGKEKNLRARSTLKTAVAGEPYVKGSMISVHLSEEKVVNETSDFELVTDAGTMVMHLEDSPLAAEWRSKYLASMRGVSTRWVTEDIVAFGSFPTSLETDRGEYRYAMYECFLALGGFDNRTTYLMVARDNHVGSYGAGRAVIGRITVGRHILGSIREGQAIREIKPLMSETSTENVIVTDDLSFVLEEGYRVDTAVRIELDRESPESAEHLLVLTSRGVLDATEVTGSLISCSEDLDVQIPEESCKVRERGAVAVRNNGKGTGRLYVYKDRRQLSPGHNSAGMVTSGMSIVSKVGQRQSFTVVTDPPRAL
ncbi:MAG: methanogenesis marker 3 protein, partial [Candidatus Methanomethylophilaceae archaeon]|nr:methanogenesis marker 3 protein [Candidatus Methanomethylophilaceae archaeon]